jgi:hypothetical protein
LVTTSAVIVPSGSLRPGINPKRVVGSAFSRTGMRYRTRTPALAVIPVSITAPSGRLSCDGFGSGAAGAPDRPSFGGSVRRVAADGLGDVIRTGLKAGPAEWVLYAVPVQEAALPDVHFGIMLGRRTAGRTLTSDIVINETEGADRAPGFHTGEIASEKDGLTTPAFAYFVGPATRITAIVGGKRVAAHLRAWSQDPDVVVFWFDPAQIGAHDTVTKLVAYDRHGRRLTSTLAGFGAG